MKFTQALVATSLLLSGAAAHPEHKSRALVSRQAKMSKRCETSVASFNRKRMAKRDAATLAKRAATAAANATYEITTESPYYSTIQNDTCVLTPDVTAGPYVWPRSQTLRQDMTEDQAGIPMWLDVGVLDMATCEPLPNALVSFWHCNATGSYSSFTGLSPNTRFEELLQELNVTDFEIGVTDLHTDATTFLRGMWPTDSDGVMEMKSIFPGFYVERAIHIHTQVFTDWTVTSNGTLVTGDLHSTGQLFFDESVESELMALEPYVSHTQINRTLNTEDAQSIYAGSFAGGYNPIVSVVPYDGEDLANGVVGYITIGVDLTSDGDVDN